MDYTEKTSHAVQVATLREKKTRNILKERLKLEAAGNFDDWY